MQPNTDKSFKSHHINKGVRRCKTKAGLASIKESDTDLVIWQRSLPSSLQDWIGKTDTANLPDVRIIVKPGELQPTLKPLLDSCGLRGGDMQNQLLADIHNLVTTFANITGSDDVDVRLERVSHDACWNLSL